MSPEGLPSRCAQWTLGEQAAAAAYPPEETHEA